jgi:hypothetical protein
MGLHQAEGFLNEFMELVDSSQRVDADDAKGLFETRGKIVRGDVQMCICPIRLSTHCHNRIVKQQLELVAQAHGPRNALAIFGCIVAGQQESVNGRDLLP